MYIYHFLLTALISFMIYSPFLKAADAPVIDEEHTSSQQDGAIPQRIKNLVKKDNQLQKLLGWSMDIEEFVIKIVGFTNRKIDSITSEQLGVMLEIFKILNKSYQAMPEKESSSRNESVKPKYSKIYKGGTKKAIKDAMITVEKKLKSCKSKSIKLYSWL